MSGDDVKGSKAPDAQQNMPDGAEPALAAASGSGEQSEITWVGAQHLMWGYCGRAPVTERPAVVAPTMTIRAAAPRHPPRERVVRVGPKLAAVAAAEIARPAAKAA